MRNKAGKYNLKFDKTINLWDEAIPLGNGKCGCLIYEQNPLRFAIDRIDLWDSREADSAKRKDFTYQTLIDMITKKEEGYWAKKKAFFESELRLKPYPTKLTCARLEFDFDSKVKNVISFLDIEKAVSDIDVLLENNEKVKVQSFMSATKFIGIVKIDGNYKLNIHAPDYIYKRDGVEYKEITDPDVAASLLVNDIFNLDYPKPIMSSQDGFTVYTQRTHTDYEYSLVIYTKKIDGQSILYYDVVTNKDFDDYIEVTKNRLKDLAEMGYDALLKEHALWWKKYWKKSQIDIPDKSLEKAYYLAYYFFASTSRKGFAPMALQGVWTADNGAVPPWRGDYHHNTNTQLSYQSFCKANRLDEGRAFIDYLWNTRHEFRKFTKKFYGVNGILVPGTSTPDSKIVVGKTQWSHAPTLSIWVAQSFDEFYLYTGDEKFLKNRAYPFFKGVAEGITALLKEENGELLLPLSTSPEIYEGSEEAYLQPNCTFDQSLLLYLYKTLISYCKKLGINYDKYQAVLDKLSPLHVSEDNILMIDKTRLLPYSHRHFSHMMAIYPLHLLSYDNEPDRTIIDATMKHIRLLGFGGWCGFSLTMCSQMYSMMRNGEAAGYMLKLFVDTTVNENGFHLNEDFRNRGVIKTGIRPFTLEATYSYCDALQEMLLQEHNGYVELFPAIPEDWKKSCAFDTLRSYNGVLVSAKIKDGVIGKANFTCNKKVTIRLKNNFGSENLKIVSNGVEKVINVCAGEVFEIEINKKTEVFAI